ncbi:hypothetical protein NFI96_015846, partial [Prochilodus magdalenae]
FSRTSRGSSSTTSLIIHPGKNITLPCNVSFHNGMVWYQQSSNELKLIMSVTWARFENEYVVDYNANSSHFQPLEGSMNSSVSLVIIGVGESDAGLYYCGGRLGGQSMRFGKTIRLTFPGVAGRETGTGLCWKLLIAAVCVLALALVLCVSMVFCRPGEGLSPSFCLNCVKENSNLKAADLQYASLRHTMISQGRRPAPASDNVTYDVVAKKTTTNPRV